MNFARARPATSPTPRARSLRRRMTWSEKLLWEELRKLGANFRRQAPLGPYFADFASHGCKVVVEVDGGVHERLDHVALSDGERELWLRSRGYQVIRFTDRQVENDAAACAAQVNALLPPGRQRPDDEGAARRVWLDRASAPPENGAVDALRSPPSPAHPPSRRTGE